jgi:hypothetical protein
MTELIWLSDVHLNFLAEPEIADFVVSVAAAPHDGILVGGDVAECGTFAPILESLSAQTDAPIYFVLGNHDAYRGSLAAAREQARQLDREVPNLHWLPAHGVIPLDDDTALIGHGLWGDGRNGDVRASRAVLNDWIAIEELAVDAELRLRRLAALGAEGAQHLQRWLPEALESYPHVVVLTHVPPFAQVNMRGEQRIDPEYLPFYTCGAAGEVLEAVMRAHPDRRATVLSGHTHGGGRHDVLPNLTLHTLGTFYGAPRFVPAPLAATTSAEAARELSEDDAEV